MQLTPESVPHARAAVPAGARSAGQTWPVTARRLAILIALCAVPAGHLVGPVADPDIWWHLRTGEWIVRHGTVPTTDSFSRTEHGQPWLAYSWLFELLAYRLHQVFGLAGIVLYRLALGLAILAAVYRFIAHREPRFPQAAALTGLVVSALMPMFQERSWLFSILFYVLTLDVVLRLRAGTAGRAAWLLPAVFALWANLHIQFVNGLALLGLACAVPLIDRVLGRNASVGRDWWRLVALTAACAAATLLTPYGVRLYVVVIDLPTQAGAYDLIKELHALPFRRWTDWAMLGLFALAVFDLGRRRPVDTFDVLLLAASAYLSFRAQRDLWLVVLAAMAVLSDARPAPAPAERFRLAPRQTAVVAAGVAVVYGLLAWHEPFTEPALRTEAAKVFPDAAAADIESHGYEGPLYNGYRWGGYLIWRLPHLPVSIDGRANLHGDARIERGTRTVEARPGWDRDPELAEARLAVLHADAPLNSLLRLDARWRQVYQDDVSTVFVARD